MVILNIDFQVRFTKLVNNLCQSMKIKSSLYYSGEVNLCDFLIVPLKDFKPVTIGWMYPKNSLLQELFDKYMLELYQTGVFWRIEKSFTVSKMCDVEIGFTQMGFDYVRLFFVLLSVGLFLAIVIGLYEKIKA